MKRILITGGAGCLGSNLIEHWLPAGHQIHVIDNFATGKREVRAAGRGYDVDDGHVADARWSIESSRSFGRTHRGA